MKEKLKFILILVISFVLVLLAVYIFQEPIIQTQEEVKKFSSQEELKNFLKENSGSYMGYTTDVAVATTIPEAKSTESLQQTRDYSQTNIQVEGVDEPDIVKNDGEYIYTVTGNKVVIVKAFPAEDMEIVSEINLTSVRNIFVNEDKLIVFSQSYNYYSRPLSIETTRLTQAAETTSKSKAVAEAERIVPPTYSTEKTQVNIYDISDKENPVIETNFSVEGNYIDSRMIDDYVYIIASKNIYLDNPEPPIYIMNGQERKTLATNIYYFPYPDTSYTFTSISAVNIKNRDYDSKVYLTGYSQNIYVSQNNIYLTSQKTVSVKNYRQKLVNEVFLKILPDSEKEKIQEILDSKKNWHEKLQEINEIVGEYSTSLTGKEKEEFDSKLIEKMQEFEIEIQKENEKTIIHKINVDENEIEYKVSGEVPGYVLNQFSMDEYNRYFRIATTTGNWLETSLNHLYVLDENLEIIGSVEDLAKGERIYSVRFLGDRAYMVTFRQVDPLFVIDLLDPQDPEVLGYLKVTGYSSYLHPYDENHIIGIGKEADEEGRVKGLKLALFDVSNVEAPTLKAKYEIEEKWSDSPALYDHKSFLFDKRKNLLVIPVSISDWQTNYYWQGSYVFNINEEEISLNGKISHFNKTQNETEKYRFYDYRYQTQRSLYIDNIIYTLSTLQVKANNLVNLEEINSLDLPSYQDYPIYYAESGEVALAETKVIPAK